MNKIKAFLFCLAGLLASDVVYAFILAGNCVTPQKFSWWFLIPFLGVNSLIISLINTLVVFVSTYVFFSLSKIKANTRHFLVIFGVFAAFQAIMIVLISSFFWRML